nr:peptidylprolyl isomerase [Brevundimonas denitrificans]
MLAGQSLHTRDGSWFVVTPAMAGQAEPPTEEQLTAYLNENAEQLRRPEFRTISLVVFSPASEADLPPITDEQIQERFEFRRESLSQAETRTFTTLTAADEETAAAIAQGLRGGSPPPRWPRPTMFSRWNTRTAPVRPLPIRPSPPPPLALKRARSSAPSAAAWAGP